MLSKEEIDTISEFFLDGAKILFGSLVVGVFVPGASGKIPWLTFIGGITITVTFLIISMKLAKTGENP